jgi:hypothetical protein
VVYAVKVLNLIQPQGMYSILVAPHSGGWQESR